MSTQPRRNASRVQYFTNFFFFRLSRQINCVLLPTQRLLTPCRWLGAFQTTSGSRATNSVSLQIRRWPYRTPPTHTYSKLSCNEFIARTRTTSLTDVKRKKKERRWDSITWVNATAATWPAAPLLGENPSVLSKNIDRIPSARERKSITYTHTYKGPFIPIFLIFQVGKIVKGLSQCPITPPCVMAERP